MYKGKKEQVFTIKLATPMSNLYVFDTISKKLLTNIINLTECTGYFIYNFPTAQNYITISNTKTFNYKIAPLIFEPNLTISVEPLDKINNWSYFNINKIFSFTLKATYERKEVNFNNYYSSLNVYYATTSDTNNLKLIGNVNISNNGKIISFTFKYDPNIINSPVLYFYFLHEKMNINCISNPFVFFANNSLEFRLNNNKLVTNLPELINIKKMYIYYSTNSEYTDQKYLRDLDLDTNIDLEREFREPNTYYLTISNYLTI
jgi:hypothetical protein